MTPTGTTAYGTPRTFSATVVNLGTGSNTFGGSISFVDTNGNTLCTSNVQQNNSLIGTTVTWSHAPPASYAYARLLDAAELSIRLV